MSHLKSVKTGYVRKFVEREPTCPGGGRVEWVIAVDEPGEGALCSFISVSEGSTSHDEKDCILLDVEAASWLHKMLGEAIEIALYAERKAKLREKRMVEGEEDKGDNEPEPA